MNDETRYDDLIEPNEPLSETIDGEVPATDVTGEVDPQQRPGSLEPHPVNLFALTMGLLFVGVAIVSLLMQTGVIAPSRSDVGAMLIGAVAAVLSLSLFLGIRRSDVMS